MGSGDTRQAAPTRAERSPWPVVARGAAALAVAMGIGRFVYTPILPLMHAQAGLSSQLGATLATANYIGYFLGAVAGTLAPGLLRSVLALRGSLILLVASVGLMAVTTDGAVWFALRLVAGIASALVFVIAVSAVLVRLREHGKHLVGWVFGGVGAGIALSGLLVLLLRSVAGWQAAWWASAALAAVLTVVAWPLRPPAPAAAAGDGPVVRAAPPHRLFAALFVAYFGEGVGYIIAGTFLVAAIEQGLPGWVGSGAWVLVGLAALPSSALYAALGRRWSTPTLLLAALLIQAVGIALPALLDGVVPALVSAVLFGATFLGVASIALAIGTELRYPRAVALLTAGYSVGQILGPLVVTPLLGHGYQQALLVGTGIVLAAAVAATALRLGWARRPG
ncbi:MAG TPA: YbfB/YjiJ family MFS transporter [Pseudonocardia sp.]|nr:YbfB/YjiJ family MFS transporter [Pseudonocardia sp.]